MKIARYAIDERTGWGTIDEEEGLIRPFDDDPRWTAAVAAGGGEEALAFTGERHALDAVRLLPPVPRSAKIVVVAANYMAHLDEMGAPPPSGPVAFLKPHGALIGARDPIAYPALAARLDYQVELVAVIGRPLVGLADPIEAVLGYTLANNVTARDLMFATGTLDFFSAKGLDRTTPVGPWIATRDRFGDAQPDIRITLAVNGERRQDAGSGTMRWSVGALLDYIDVRSALEPGDIVLTGTPGGVGQATGRLLAPGDLVEAEGQGIGRLVNRLEEPDRRHSAA